MTNSEKLLSIWINDINKSITSKEKNTDSNVLLLKSIGNTDEYVDINIPLEVTMTFDFSSFDTEGSSWLSWIINLQEFTLTL